MDSFKDGYSFFEKISGSNVSAFMGSNYVDNVNEQIQILLNNLNQFKGYKTKTNVLKGDIAEFWHSGTFNINAAVQGSQNKTFVNRSHDFASVDISSNFGKDFGLKYYQTGTESAKQQAKSIFERFKESGESSLDDFLTKRGLDTDAVLNDPIYKGQVRVIPKDQLKEAVRWLEKNIIKERVNRPEQVARYQETLRMLKDKIEDGKGVESISLSREEAEKLANLAKQGKVTDNTLKELGVSTEELIKYEYVLKQAFKAGITSATISMVLSVAPEIYNAIDYLIKNGELDEKQFQKIGFAALNGGCEGFLRGVISASITTACKAGLWGEAWKKIDPSVIGVVTVIAMDTMKNSFKVATGKMESRELACELIKEMFISTCSLVCGGIAQSFIEIPVFGYMLGSFMGSVIGSFAYNVGYNAVISFCIDTGFTMFGLVEQDYTLPDYILKEIGINVFEYEKFTYKKFEPEKFTYKKFSYKKFTYEKFRNNELSINFLRRGIIGVNKIGYI